MPKDVLQSNTSAGALAGDPARVLEPFAKALAQDRRARRRLRIAVYRTRSRACDLTVAAVQDAIRELGIEKAVDFKIRSWWLWWWLPLAQCGAWHAPILVIDGKVFSQGAVPDKEELKKYLLHEVT